MRRLAPILALMVVAVDTLPTPALAQASCRCECTMTPYGKRCRRVCRPPAVPIYRAPPSPTVAAYRSPSASAESGVPLLPLLAAVAAMLLLLRVLRLASAAQAAPFASSPLGDRSPRWSWAARKRAKLEAKTATTRAATDFLRSQAEEAQARQQLSELLAELADTSAPAAQPGTAPTAPPTLSLAELEALIHAMHELTPAQRVALLRVLALRLQENDP